MESPRRSSRLGDHSSNIMTSRRSPRTALSSSSGISSEFSISFAPFCCVIRCRPESRPVPVMRFVADPCGDHLDAVLRVFKIQTHGRLNSKTKKTAGDFYQGCSEITQGLKVFMNHPHCNPTVFNHPKIFPKIHPVDIHIVEIRDMGTVTVDLEGPRQQSCDRVRILQPFPLHLIIQNHLEEERNLTDIIFVLVGAFSKGHFE